MNPIRTARGAGLGRSDAVGAVSDDDVAERSSESDMRLVLQRGSMMTGFVVFGLQKGRLGHSLETYAASP